MASAADYKIKKLEKGPLQRFKNQNLLLKKFGEVGLQVYKSMTGKRSTEELRKDLGIDSDMFGKIINYMKDTQMIDLEPMDGAPQEESQESTQPETQEPEEAPPEEEALEPEPPLQTRKSKPESKSDSEPKKRSKSPEPEPMTIEPEIQPEPFEEEAPLAPPPSPSSAKKKRPEPEMGVDIGTGFGSGTSGASDEIQPIDLELEGAGEVAQQPKKKAKQPEPDYGEGLDLGPEPGSSGQEASDEGLPPEGQAPAEEEVASEGVAPAEEEAPSEEISPVDQGLEPGIPGPAPSSLSSVEKIIFDRYGDLGLRVYALIDGARTAEEIMRETGVSESKLVEILDFMDEQGIIKLDYPKQPPPAAQQPGQQQPGQPFSPQQPPLAPMTPGAPPPQYPSQYQQPGGALPPLAPPREQPGFVPMAEGDQAIDEAGPVPSPLELPVKAPLDLVKGVQMRAKIMMKYGDKGGRVMELIDGKNDVLDVALKMDLPLPTISEMFRFLMENGLVVMKPLLRGDVKKKYGDDGYAVYKRYGKEGLMLYELIGKDLTIKQMADKVTTDKVKVIEMFLFIHQVLGIELSIDKDVLAKQLGI